MEDERFPAQLRKLELPNNPEIYIAEQLKINSFQVLPIELRHTLQTYYLPNHHKDPFDRILVAQSQIENQPPADVRCQDCSVWG